MVRARVYERLFGRYGTSQRSMVADGPVKALATARTIHALHDASTAVHAVANFEHAPFYVAKSGPPLAGRSFGRRYHEKKGDRTVVMDPSVTFSVVMVTFARDQTAPRAIDRIRAITEGRHDVEFVLVDNNPDDIDRTAMISDFPLRQYLKMGWNKGVAARNDGASRARGRYLLFVDDDDVLHPETALISYETAFENDPTLAIVTARVVNHITGRTPRKVFPHTNKTLPQDKPFLTFRFQGSGFALRREAFEQVGPMSEDFFYGLEEIDYAYRIVDAGFRILYEPSVWIAEYTEPAGRMATQDVEEMRLTNKYIISYKYMPALYLPLNMLLFTMYVLVLNRGRINPLRSFMSFLDWRRGNSGRRRPIGRAARRYIRECGGQIWK